MRSQPIFGAAFDGGYGGEVETTRHVSHRRVDDLWVRNAAAQQHRSARRVIGRSCGEVVENADARTLCKQRLAKMGSDKSATAGHQVVCHLRDKPLTKPLDSIARRLKRNATSFDARQLLGPRLQSFGDSTSKLQEFLNSAAQRSL